MPRPGGKRGKAKARKMVKKRRVTVDPAMAEAAGKLERFVDKVSKHPSRKGRGFKALKALSKDLRAMADGIGGGRVDVSPSDETLNTFRGMHPQDND